MKTENGGYAVFIVMLVAIVGITMIITNTHPDPVKGQSKKVSYSVENNQFEKNLPDRNLAGNAFSGWYGSGWCDKCASCIYAAKTLDMDAICDCETGNCQLSERQTN